tara:strand:- start:10671 stop:11036 length:366 start_codon:yes stop_codon:yes gene_type:complete
MDAKQQALFLHVHGAGTVFDSEEHTEPDPEAYDDCVFNYEGSEYRVLTESEADAAWDEYLDNYLEECILPELPEVARSYFDEEAWKRDAKFDGRGHCLSGYDGTEHEFLIGDEWIFVYRTN